MTDTDSVINSDNAAVTEGCEATMTVESDDVSVKEKNVDIDILKVAQNEEKRSDSGVVDITFEKQSTSYTISPKITKFSIQSHNWREGVEKETKIKLQARYKRNKEEK